MSNAENSFPFDLNLPYNENNSDDDVMEMAEKKLKLKLLVDSNANKVVFAEAGKEFVDFLFHIMSLPVGTVVQLLNDNGMTGSIGSLYKSVESLDSGYFQPNVNKDAVLKPKTGVYVPLLLNLNDGPTSHTVYRCCKCFSYVSPVHNATCPGCHHKIITKTTYVPSDQNVVVDTVYKCGSCFNYASRELDATCPGCRSKINTKMTYVPSEDAVYTATTVSNAFGGYVKEMITYIVMDNLEVKPMSTNVVINQMNKFNVKDVSALTEKEVEVGFDECRAMLKASFEVANTVLTTVFLSKQEGQIINQ